MYAALWRIIPGTFWVKVAVLTVAAAVVITLLMLFVFPAVDDLMSSREVTVNQ